MKKKQFVKLLKKARKHGCSCIVPGPSHLCGACLASNILNKKKPGRHKDFDQRLVTLISEQLGAGISLPALDESKPALPEKKKTKIVKNFEEFKTATKDVREIFPSVLKK